MSTPENRPTEAWAVLEQGFGQGVYVPARYYWNKTKAEEDAEAAGTDEEHRPFRKVKRIEIQ